MGFGFASTPTSRWNSARSAAGRAPARASSWERVSDVTPADGTLASAKGVSLPALPPWAPAFGGLGRGVVGRLPCALAPPPPPLAFGGGAGRLAIALGHWAPHLQGN